MSLRTTLITSVLLAADLVAGHGAIISATGDSGGSGMALGIDTSTPRDGTRRRPFQQDTTRFRGDAEETVGETLGGGDNDVESGTQAIMDETGDSLPQVSPGGEVSMTLHQVNADGAGPYTCMINDDGTATSWQDITVTENVPGDDGRDRDGEETDFPLTASIPEDQECTGTVAGQDNVCLVRCENPARNGPFGGVVPVQMAAGNGGGNATEDAGAGEADGANSAENSEESETGGNDTEGSGTGGNDTSNNSGEMVDSSDDEEDSDTGNDRGESTVNSSGDSTGNGGDDSDGSANDSEDSDGNDNESEDRNGNNSKNGSDGFEARRRLARRWSHGAPRKELLD